VGILECSGNSGLTFFDAGIGNAVWAGTPLAPLLEEAGVLEDGREVVFYGVDAGEETIGEQTVVQNFARSLSLEDAMNPANLLVYEMNGEALPAANGSACGTPIQAVELKIDDGEWQPATLDTTQQADHAWTFWSLDWMNPAVGEHSITSRAIDTDGNLQPAADDPSIVNKMTYWESNGQITRRISIA
jgi:hypothetical protein